MLADLDIYQQLQQFAINPQGDLIFIYGDLAYPLRPQLQTPFRNLHMNQQQNEYNIAMSKVRISVEWVFGDITNFLKFLDFKKNLKIFLSPIGKMYIVCPLLMNFRTCLYRSMS